MHGSGVGANFLSPCKHRLDWVYLEDHHDEKGHETRGGNSSDVGSSPPLTAFSRLLQDGCLLQIRPGSREACDFCSYHGWLSRASEDKNVVKSLNSQ
jgi:hypothetical protein